MKHCLSRLVLAVVTFFRLVGVLTIRPIYLVKIFPEVIRHPFAKIDKIHTSKFLVKFKRLHI